MKTEKTTQKTQTAETAIQASSINQDLLKELTEKVAKGEMTQEEALQKMFEAGQASKPKTTRQVVDRIAYIQEMTSIQEVRKARKIAYAKKSKSKDKPEAIARYEQEIKTATDKLTQMLQVVNSSESPWKTALEMGETVDGALQLFIQDLEQEVEAEWKVQGKPYTKAQVKTFCQSQDIAQVAKDLIPEPLQETFTNRLNNKDQRLKTLAQNWKGLQTLKQGKGKPQTEKKEQKSA